MSSFIADKINDVRKGLLNGYEIDVSNIEVKTYGYDVFGNKVEIPINEFSQYVPRPTKFNTPNMQRKAAMMSSSRQDWQTPLWYYQEICKERNINYYDCDPATSKDNPLGCASFWTIEEDGLTKSWYGPNVFINPPFGWGYYKGKWTYLTGRWIEEAYNRSSTHSEIQRVTMIIPARTSTKAFHKYIWDYDNARARPGVIVNFKPRRLKFGNSKMVAPFDTLIVDFIRDG